MGVTDYFADTKRYEEENFGYELQYHETRADERTDGEIVDANEGHYLQAFRRRV